MTKVKEKLYEHRFGLFFFGLLIVYCVVDNSMQWGSVVDVTYSFHIVDFSIGVCNKLLAGAISNFLLGEVTREKLQVYLSVLLLLCFFLVALLLEKVILKAGKEIRRQVLILSIFFLTGAFTFSFHFEFLVWFDFYWLLVSVLCIFALQKKETYILVIPLMLGAVMVHYGAIICYVPFIAIIILYKLSQTTEKKEKRYLWIVWILLVVSTIGLAIYMVATESENIKISYDELNSFLISRGVPEDSLRYYQFSFFREEAAAARGEDKMMLYEEYVKATNRIKEIFPEFLQVVAIQIYTTFFIGRIRSTLQYMLLILPLIAVIYGAFIIDYKSDKKNKLKRFSLFCIMMLFFLVVIGGKSLSTDTIRWMSNALIPVFSFLFYIIFKGNKESKEKINEMLSRLPILTVGIYYVVYAFMV